MTSASKNIQILQEFRTWSGYKRPNFKGPYDKMPTTTKDSFQKAVFSKDWCHITKRPHILKGLNNKVPIAIYIYFLCMHVGEKSSNFFFRNIHNLDS